ncbi:MAG: transporter substrate-binding domain-containing protein, partial [Candidatus Spechtbacteria bacterium]|nr:transporter substrate-binding domain-containing protein [Candidatus Spechtbacteria bacterium]
MRHTNPRKDRGRSYLAIIAGAVALIAVLIAASFMTVSRASDPRKDTLIVGTSTDFPPFERRFGEEVRGFDMDLCGKIADALGRKMAIRDMAFDALLPSLGRGATDKKPLVDIVCSAVTKTSARDEVADFSSAYFTANQAVLTAKGLGLSYTSPKDLTGLFIVYQEGTTSQEWFEKNVREKIPIKGHASFKEMRLALQRLGKDFDGIILDGPAAQAFAKSNENLVVAGTIQTGEEYGFAVAEGDPQHILPAANEALKKMRESGEYDVL